MSYRLLYFAALAESAGCHEQDWPVETSDASSLYAAVRRRHGIKLPRERLRLAVNGVFVGWDRPLEDGDEIAFIPPVSGG